MASKFLAVLLPAFAWVLFAGCAGPVLHQTPMPSSPVAVATVEQPTPSGAAQVLPLAAIGADPATAQAASPLAASNSEAPASRPAMANPGQASALSSRMQAAPARTSAAVPFAPPLPLGAAEQPSPGPKTGGAPFPGTLLIADAGNNRLIEVTAAKQIVWSFPISGSLPARTSFHYPDDAFFSPDGRYILVNEEYDHVISAIDYAQRKLAWRHGVPGQPGTDLQHFNRPDDAHMLPDGRVVVADIRNCRILIIPWDHQNVQAIGRPGDCTGKAGGLAKPNGVTLLPNGHLLVTEIATRRVSEMDLQGNLIRSVKLPLYYPSDAFLTPRDTMIVADYHMPGRVIEADWQGQVLWSFPPAGSGEHLDRTSIAFELPNGNVIIADDHRHRVIVVDRAGQIVWQYGETDRPGRGPGYLNTPDGLDLHLVTAAG